MAYNSREVRIGNVIIGAGHPVVVQSMTNTHTMDTDATVNQSIRMIEAGCEMVRITAQGVREAAHLAVIKKVLKSRGYEVPLIADIHYSPAAAETAARIVEKIRINPGNYVERNTQHFVEYTDNAYNSELEKTALKLYPLLNICREYGTAIRIGTNHGSLSQRIVSRYGDTPEGMVQSALEFTRICNSYGFHNLVLSMKSSNVCIMVDAYRMLAQKLQDEGLNYPLHLGVTEAGDGDDGRIKSAVGIGALLAKGIGDTIRVSLTEPPEAEIPVAQYIVRYFQNTSPKKNVSAINSVEQDVIHTGELKRKTNAVEQIGGHHPVAAIGIYQNQWHIADDKSLPVPMPETFAQKLIRISKAEESITPMPDERDSVTIDATLAVIRKQPDCIVLADGSPGFNQKLAYTMLGSELMSPLLIQVTGRQLSKAELLLHASIEAGPLLLDGAGDGICIQSDVVDLQELVNLSLGLLQATRRRISRTEFISCPSCGRTLFDIQETLQQVKARTSHLKGLKIAVMGCIVNGPGEMADADYGYVGAGNGKVTLYKGKEAVKKGIPQHEAVNALIQLIGANGQWVEP